MGDGLRGVDMVSRACWEFVRSIQEDAARKTEAVVLPSGWSVAAPMTGRAYNWLVRNDGYNMLASADPAQWAEQIREFEFAEGGNVSAGQIAAMDDAQADAQTLGTGFIRQTAEGVEHVPLDATKAPDADKARTIKIRVPDSYAVALANKPSGSMTEIARLPYCLSPAEIAEFHAAWEKVKPGPAVWVPHTPPHPEAMAEIYREAIRLLSDALEIKPPLIRTAEDGAVSLDDGWRKEIAAARNPAASIAHLPCITTGARVERHELPIHRAMRQGDGGGIVR